MNLEAIKTELREIGAVGMELRPGMTLLLVVDQRHCRLSTYTRLEKELTAAGIHVILAPVWGDRGNVDKVIRAVELSDGYGM